MQVQYKQIQEKYTELAAIARRTMKYNNIVW